MASVNFFLKDSKDKKKKSILYIQINFKVGDKFEKVRFSVGEKLYPRDWNQVKQKSKLAELNNHLNKLDKKANALIAKAKNQNIILSKDYFKMNWPKTDEEETESEVITLEKALDEYLKTEAVIRTRGTMIQKRSAFNHFRNFCAEYNMQFEFKSIDLRFYDKFLEYCHNLGNLHNGQIGNLIKNLKAFLNWSTERGYNSKLDFRKKAFKKPVSEPEIIYLTDKELFQLYKAEMPNKKYSNVRDFFCFGCFTGLRYSDIRKLTPSNLVYKKVKIGKKKETICFLEIRVKKTKDFISQPLNKYALEILNRHKSDYSYCFKMMSQLTTNELIKIVAKIAKINRLVNKTKIKGAQTITEEAPLHKILTFHISKKTFMTNFLAKGGSLLTAMSLTGNKDYKTAKRYFKVVDDLKVEEMMRVFN